MMKDYLADAIKSLRPSSEFSFIEQDYSSIKWDVLDGEAPTQSEIDAEIAKMKADEITAAQTKATAKAALLDRLGMTADEAALLLS
jgi:hypothetical protein